MRAAKFIKSEFAVSVVIALLVVAFVHVSARRRAREEAPMATGPPPNLFKVFAVALCAAYLIMYLLVGGEGGGRAGPPAAASAAAPLSGGGIDSALREAMRYIDAGEPDF